MLVPLLAMVAFAVDLNYVWRAETELQTAADAGAQAGTLQLMQYPLDATQPGLTAADLDAVRLGALTAVRARAGALVRMHSVADDGLDLNDDDVELGFIADPAARADAPLGQFLTG